MFKRWKSQENVQTISKGVCRKQQSKAWEMSSEKIKINLEQQIVSEN